MKKTLFFLLLLTVTVKISAQEYIFGKVISDTERELPDVSVVNVSSQQSATTNSDGDFMIFAKAGDELRFSQKGYARVSKKVTAQNISSSFQIILERLPQEIEEVEIKYKLSGDLKKDADHFGKSKKLLQLDKDLGSYISQKSAPGLLDAKAGEFVQPVGPGFSVGRITAKWNDIDLNADLRKNIPQEFFTTELHLAPAEISSFIFYVLKDFERVSILKYGSCSAADYERFQREALSKISAYKSNKPNESKDKSRKLRLKDRAPKFK